MEDVQPFLSLISSISPNLKETVRHLRSVCPRCTQIWKCFQYSSAPFKTPKPLDEKYVALTLKLRPGGTNSRNDPDVWLWYSNSTRRAEHAKIGGTSQRVANSGVRALWSWKFWKKKCGKIIEKFQNLLEVLKWHENNRVGEFRGVNEIHELFFPFDPSFPLNWHRDFYGQI